jgi:hypothetical protein
MFWGTRLAQGEGFPVCHSNRLLPATTDEFRSVDVIVCIDACFTQKRSRNPWGAEGHDPPNPTSSVFIPSETVTQMEVHVERCRSKGKERGQRVLRPSEDEDRVEEGMRVPASVLDGCGESFVAADEKREKASTHFFADTGLMALLCRHDRVLWLVNMTSTGEKQHYALALIQQLTQHIPDDMRVGLLYDIGCQLERSWRKFKFFANSILSRFHFAISVFHAYGHQWPCQVVYHPRKRQGFGLSDGEGCEQLWSALKPLIGPLRVSGVSLAACCAQIRPLSNDLSSITNVCLSWTCRFVTSMRSRAWDMVTGSPDGGAIVSQENGR